ncbi:MAG: HSP20 family protein [Candidatus Nitrotoga sp. MKT]|nr:MAG: HSP20 family protein [Candidatus Nitrotoga sp. MKT]
MHYRGIFPRDLFTELERLQREFDGSPSIRGAAPGYPAMNVGTTPKSVEVYAFAPGMTPEEFDVQVENGVLTISGERKNIVPPEGATIHIGEHFSGRFRRVVSLPDDIEPNSTTASYRDGVLHVCVARREAAQSRRISVQ